MCRALLFQGYLLRTDNHVPFSTWLLKFEMWAFIYFLGCRGKDKPEGKGEMRYIFWGEKKKIYKERMWILQ